MTASSSFWKRSSVSAGVIVVLVVVILASQRQKEKVDPIVATGTVLTLTAPGMHCESCAETVRSTMTQIDGVDSVRVNLETKTVLVIVDTTRISEDSLKQVITRLGFDAPPLGM